MIWPFGAKIPKLATRIAITPPEPAANRAPLAIVLIAKNEAARIWDWLAFHAIAGASHVILYDNGSTDNTVEIARAFKGLDITVVPWKLNAAEFKTGMRLHQQSLAYAHAVCTYGHQFQRMAFIDTDEFLVPREALTLHAALEGLPYPNISLPWTMFGHDGHDITPQDAVPFAFRTRAPVSHGPLLNFKCIVDPCEVTMVNPHRFETRGMTHHTVNTKGIKATNKARGGDFVCHDIIQLNHYYLLSEQEMWTKINGSSVSQTAQEQRKQAILQKRDLIESEPIIDNAAADFLARHNITSTDDLRNAF
ncbi:glycosyl transferase family 92 [Yoonia maricola]|uniref:Glycosyl transferase family 92 n=1 Tax=Yoonia maricola TaxID=420999 RepID=A0A2M8W294_9RHOB|nr:glycosyltransferase family 92 protein [Yoonia maricola]PJI85052.1 glycosyl transferase family 92 [Yoonia maricola]